MSHRYSSSHIPRTDDIIPRHGFISGLFGRRTRSFGSGGSGRLVTDLTVAFCGFGTIATVRFSGYSGAISTGRGASMAGCRDAAVWSCGALKKSQSGLAPVTPV